MNNTQKPVDYDFIIKTTEAKLQDDLIWMKSVKDKMNIIEERLKSPIITAEYSGENRVDKELELANLRGGYNEALANVKISNDALLEYKTRKANWDKYISTAFKEAAEGGFDKLIKRAREINSSELNKHLKIFETVVKDKSLNREQKAQSYLAFKDMIKQTESLNKP